MWRLCYFLIYSFNESLRRFISDRSQVIREVLVNCENLISTVSTFENACSGNEVPASEKNLCIGVWRLRGDARACIERISLDRELMSKVGIGSIIAGVGETDPYRSAFYGNLAGFVTKPDVCNTRGESVCIDWGSILCIDLLTSLVFGLLPFGTTSGSRWSLLIAFISVCLVGSVQKYLKHTLHCILRRYRMSRVISLLFPLEWLMRTETLKLAMSCAFLISCYTVTGNALQQTVMLQALIRVATTPVWITVYYSAVIYSILIITFRMSPISDEIRTRLSLEELREIDEDIVRLWSEGSIADLERLSDAALMEFLLRVDIERIRPFRDQLYRQMQRRPCFRVLMEDRENLKSLQRGELQDISARLCKLFQRDHAVNSGFLVGSILVIGYGIYTFYIWN